MTTNDIHLFGLQFNSGHFDVDIAQVSQMVVECKTTHNPLLAHTACQCSPLRAVHGHGGMADQEDIGYLLGSIITVRY